MCNSPKLIGLAAVFVFALGAAAEAAVTLVQSQAGQQGPGSDTQAFSMNTVTGNTVVVALVHLSGTYGAYGVSDATNGAYASAGDHSQIVWVRHFRNITGGFTTISITAPASDSSYRVMMFELAGASNTLALESGLGDDPAGTTNHNTLDSGISGTGFAVAANAYGSSGGTTTAGAGWTLDSPSSDAGSIVQHRIATFSVDTGPFSTSTGTESGGIMVIFPEDAGGPPPPSGPLLTDLVEYWKLDEASGDRAGAHDGLTLTANGTGGVGSAMGQVYSLAADLESGESDYLDRADGAELSVCNCDFTLAAWVNNETEGANRAYIFKGNESSSIFEYLLIYNNSSDRFQFEIASADGYTNRTSVTANNFGAPTTATWYFLVAWHDATANTINIQVNNGTANSTGYTFGGYDGSGPFHVGWLRPYSDTYHDGLLGPVMFWKRVLTVDERAALYNSGNGLAYESFTGAAGGHRRRLLLGVGD